MCAGTNFLQHGVEQTNTCSNIEECSLVVGFHAHGDQPLMAATRGGSHSFQSLMEASGGNFAITQLRHFRVANG